MTAQTFSAAQALPFIQECGKVSAPDLVKQFDIEIKQEQSALYRLLKANSIHVIYHGGGSQCSIYGFGPNPAMKTVQMPKKQKSITRPVPKWCGAKDMEMFLVSIKPEICDF